MSSPFLITSTDNLVSPPSSAPKYEKDYAIISGVTKSMLDFSNPETTANTGSFGPSAVFNDLVSGGGTATLQSTASLVLAPVYNGTLRAAGAVQAPVLTLPAGFNIAASARRLMFILWFRAPRTGWTTSVARTLGLFGCGTTAGVANVQAYASFSTSGGSVTKAQFNVSNGTAYATAVISDEATLNALFDGNLHQIGFAFDCSTGIGTPSMIIDKVAASSAAVTTQSFSSGVVQPSSIVYKLMTAAGCTPLTDATAPDDGITVASLDCREGRPSYHDLTDRDDLAFTDILSRDWDNSVGYLS